MLQAVRNPQGKWIRFEYDALGRRTAKIANTKIYRYLWDGNAILHEWFYECERRPKIISDELGMLMLEQPEPVENLTTWVYEEGSLAPTAKLCEGKSYSIVSDYLGRPAQAYDDKGELVWQVEFDIYGRIRENLFNNKSFIPFRQLGQYEDKELDGLYYNRFRYYDSNTGTYISQDPIGLEGGIKFYSYVHDSNIEIDPLGMEPIMVNPKDINFSQTTINKNFDIPDNVAKSLGQTKNKINIDKYANVIKKSGADNVMKDMNPIRVVHVKGQYVVRDGNSRLYLARQSKASSIPIEIVTNVDELKEFNSRLKRNGLPNKGTSKLPKCK